MSDVTRAEYEDAAAAIRTLAKRLETVEEGLKAAIFTISTLIEIVDEIDHKLMDRKLRELRLWVQSSETGRVDSKVTQQNRMQLKILETALQRRGD